MGTIDYSPYERYDKRMTAQEIVSQLEPLGTEGYRRIMRNHGVEGPLFGVKVLVLKQYLMSI